MEQADYPLTFIVRLMPGEGGVLSGIVERVRSGEKQRFHGVGALAEVIAAMAERETKTTHEKESG